MPNTKRGFCIWHGNERAEAATKVLPHGMILKSHVNDRENNEGVSERQDEDTKKEMQVICAEENDY